MNNRDEERDSKTFLLAEEEAVPGIIQPAVLGSPI